MTSNFAYKFCNESSKRQHSRGRCNPGQVLIVRREKVTYVAELACGSNDRVDFFLDGDHLIVVCVNDGMEYVGVEEFSLLPTNPDDDLSPRKEAVQTRELFCQNREEWESLLGKNGLDLKTSTIAKRLLENC